MYCFIYFPERALRDVHFMASNNAKYFGDSGNAPAYKCIHRKPFNHTDNYIPYGTRNDRESISTKVQKSSATVRSHERINYVREERTDTRILIALAITLRCLRIRSLIGSNYLSRGECFMSADEMYKRR